MDLDDFASEVAALSKWMAEKSKTMLTASDHLDDTARECARSASLAFSAAAARVNEVREKVLDAKVKAP